MQGSPRYCRFPVIKKKHWLWSILFAVEHMTSDEHPFLSRRTNSCFNGLHCWLQTIFWLWWLNLTGLCDRYRSTSLAVLHLWMWFVYLIFLGYGTHSSRISIYPHNIGVPRYHWASLSMRLCSGIGGSFRLFEGESPASACSQNGTRGLSSRISCVSHRDFVMHWNGPTSLKHV